MSEQLPGWRPSREDPLMILAMDHRDPFAKTLFDVENDCPTPDQRRRMQAAKTLIYAGLRRAKPQLPWGRAGVLADEDHGSAVIEAARGDGVVLACRSKAAGRSGSPPSTATAGWSTSSGSGRTTPKCSSVIIRGCQSRTAKLSSSGWLR